MAGTKVKPPTEGYDPGEVWHQIKTAFLQARLPPILDTYYENITKSIIPAESVEFEPSVKKDIVLLRIGILAVVARLALLAMESMRPSAKILTEASGTASYLDDECKLLQEAEAELQHLRTLPPGEDRNAQIQGLLTEAAIYKDKIVKLVADAKKLGQLFSGRHGKDRVVIYLWLSLLRNSNAVNSAAKLRDHLEKHASRADFAEMYLGMQEAADMQVAVADETLDLLRLELAWTKPPSPKTILDIWAPSVMQAFMAECGIPVSATRVRKKSKRKRKSVAATAADLRPPLRGPAGDTTPHFTDEATGPMIVPQAGPNVQLTGAAPALGPIAEGGGGRNGEKEHASSWEAVLRQLIRWRVIELDLPGGRMKLSSLPGKSLGQAWQIAERILKGNFPAQYQCIVTGPVGPDKTALLRKIEKLLARQGFTPHYVDCSATRLPQDLVELLQALTAQVVVQVNPDPTPDEFGEVYRALQFSHALNRLWILLDNADAWMRLPQGQETMLRLIGKQNVVAAAVMPLHMPEDWQQFTLAAPAVGRRWLARAGAPVSDGESRINHWLASLPSLSSDRLTYWVLCDCVAHDQDSSALAVVTTCRRHLEHWLDPLNLTLAQYLELPYHARSWVELMTMGIELSAEKPIASVARIRQEAGGLFQKHQAGTLDERGRLRLAWLIEHYTGIESEAYRA